MSFPNFLQHDFYSCGPTCLRIIAKFYGKDIGVEKVNEICEKVSYGTNLRAINQGASLLGFVTEALKVDFMTLKDDIKLPCIIHWNQNHFAVLYKIESQRLYVSDPATGLIKYNNSEFKKGWCANLNDPEKESGIVLQLKPTDKFHSIHKSHGTGLYSKIEFIIRYLRQYQKYFWQLCVALLFASLIQLIFPFSTQLLFDVGIQNKNFEFIKLILFAQCFLILGRISSLVSRDWIILHMGTRLNVQILADFFIKLMKLPISFFDSKITGDLLQRIQDHKRIEHFITRSAISFLFSIFNIVVYSVILLMYSPKILAVFLIGSSIYLIWVFTFIDKRREIDYKMFAQFSSERNLVIQMIEGVKELKLNNAEDKKRWHWEELQAKLFKLSVRSLKLEQTQSIGSELINEIKNILLTVFCAYLVINGEITIGMMLSVTYLIGQLNGPLSLLITFMHDYQDAKIGLERLAIVHNTPNEDDLIADGASNQDIMGQSICLANVSFRYSGSQSLSLKNISCSIPANQTTAIVGESGSGKTTLMKLLLKFYAPIEGSIMVGEKNLSDIPNKNWREFCGVVMQEGYIFEDTIANNIILGADQIDRDRMRQACERANIKEFIEGLPLEYETKIGGEGIGLSMGQRQRILIARSIYRDPAILIFDEATSALDARNEKLITDGINAFSGSKTLIIIAHRFSTIRRANQIIVLKNGGIEEIGTHQDLIDKRGEYFRLFENQFTDINEQQSQLST